MGRPRRTEDDVATVQRLLDAAGREFARRGFGEARLEDIAAGAGITRSSLLYHYESKDALYRAVVHGAILKLAAALAPAMSVGGSFEVQVESLVAVFLSFLEAHPALAPLLMRDLLDGRGPGHAFLLEQVKPVLDAVEAFVKRHGRGRVRKRLPVRAALMQIVSGALMRAAAGDLAMPLWGPDRTRVLARLLIFEE